MALSCVVFLAHGAFAADRDKVKAFLTVTGFDVALGGDQSSQTLLLMRLFDILVPLAFSGIAIWLIASYPITEKVAADVRRELEQRRGTVT